MKEFIDKLIERLEEAKAKAKPWDFGGVCLAIEITNKLAEEYKVSEMPTGWIPCSERLPEEKEYDDGCVEPSNDVLVFTKYGGCKVSRYWGNRRNQRDYYDWVDIKLRTDEVIAWMPLPAPYTEGE